MNTDAPILLEVSLTPKDLVTSPNRLVRNVFRWFFIVLGVFLLIELVDIPGFRFHPLTHPWSFGILMAIATVAGIYLPYLQKIEMFKKFPTLGRSRRIEITPRGLQVESEDAKGEYKWPLFCEIEESDKNFLLKQTSAAAIYLPKRCFQSAEEIARFRSLLRAQYPGHLKLRSQ